jgi:hypothetical protein
MNVNLSNDLSMLDSASSYLDYVHILSSLPYEQVEHSYHIEPIYYPKNRTLFVPYGFLYISNKTIDFAIVKLLLKILRQTIRIDPFTVDCLMKSSENRDLQTNDVTDEHIMYLLFRSKFLLEQQIILDEYLWPYMSANMLMKHFLIDYTLDNYCSINNKNALFHNNTYLVDDIHLVFHCRQASTIRQSKCTII